MRELTPAEKRKYDKMVLGSRQISLHDFLDTVPDVPDPSPNEIQFPSEIDSKIQYTQMELFK